MRQILYVESMKNELNLAAAPNNNFCLHSEQSQSVKTNMNRKAAIHSFGLPGVQVSPRLPLLAEFNKQLGGQAEIW